MPEQVVKKSKDYTIDALTKGLVVLQTFTEQEPVQRLTDISARTGILMPTVYRIAMTFVAEGFLEKLADGRYRPTAKVLTLGFAALQDLDVVEAATPILKTLSDISGETVNLGVLSEDRVLYLLRFKTTELVTANIQVGSRLPAIHSSMGKVLLAELPLEQMRMRIAESNFASPAGPNAKHDLASLENELDDIRRQGFAQQDEEVAFGLRSIAVPLYDAHGAVAAANIAVNAMEWSMERLLNEGLPQLQKAAHSISRMLGARV